MLAANIESFFIFMLIAGASALFNWIKKRKESQNDWSDAEKPTPPPRTSSSRPYSTPTPRPEKSMNWEEELRRMLEGAVPTTQAPAPPPIVIQEKRTPPPIPRRPAPARSEPAPASTMSLPKSFEQKFYKAHCNFCDGHIEFPASAMDEMVACPFCHRQTVLRPFENTAVEILAHQTVMADFQATEKAYDDASQLSRRVAAHMHEVGHVPVGLTSVQHATKLWPEVAETKALFKNAKSVRQAMIASLIFGSPKALEN